MGELTRIDYVLGGVEDLLLGQGQVSQTRNGQSVTVTKLNADVIPYSGEGLTAISIKQAIDAGLGGGTTIVEDVLTSTSVTSALSANQGRVLNTTKQATLVNTVNIKSVNGQSLLGSGNLEITSESLPSYYEFTTATVGQITFSFPSVIGLTTTNSIAIVFVDGVQQAFPTNYTRTSGNEFTFSSAFIGGESVDVVFLGNRADSAALALTDLTDVTITTPSTGQTLSYNGTQWVNSVGSSSVNALTDLTDVTITAPSIGQTLSYNGTQWVNSVGSSSVNALTDLTDVTITAPSIGQTLSYNGAQWVNSAGSSSVNALTDLTDVTITAPSTGQTLSYNGTQWVNSTSTSAIGWVPDSTTHDYHIPSNGTADSAGIRMYGASTDMVMLDNYRPAGQVADSGFRVLTAKADGSYVVPIQTYATGEVNSPAVSAGVVSTTHVTYNYRLNFNSKVSGVTPATTNVKLSAAIATATYGDHVLKTQSIVNPAFVTGPAVYTPTIWGSNELQLKNTGEGRVNNTNMLLEVGGNIRSDNTNLFLYQKAGAYAQNPSLEYGGTVGIWMVADARNTDTRAIGGEIVMIGDKLEYDVNPNGSLATIPSIYSTEGKASFGWRVSNLEAATTEGQTTPPCIFPRAIDVWGAGNKGFDTALALNGWRSRGLYIGNTLNATVQGGAGWGIHIERNVPNILVTGTTAGAPGEQYNLSFQQQYSVAKNAQYFTFRKDANTTWLSMYNDATVTLSTTSNGAGLTIYPSGLVLASRTGAGAANAAFGVPTNGRVYLDGGVNTYFTFDGTNVKIVKNGVTVASW